MMRLFYFIRYAFIFLKELIIANYQVARLVVSPKLNIQPGFLAVPMRAETDFEITGLAHSITLTPGTISIHVSDDRKHIVIHSIDVRPDAELVRRNVSETLEANLLKWTRPAESGENTHKQSK